ncbi:MAG TPA: hypothetical protein VFJ94_00400 [Intrasporangium sp.]|uniref:hypothetical protein n=1 Tax=Intrasporangium sp. TaxID=1925024 RepID=UPI002D76EE35|nr:hypothetical protein [Intrasporangium sp.]HET7396956.1 hypothetical protein [Intrasporangium sp.]
MTAVSDSVATAAVRPRLPDDLGLHELVNGFVGLVRVLAVGTLLADLSAVVCPPP